MFQTPQHLLNLQYLYNSYIIVFILPICLDPDVCSFTYFRTSRWHLVLRSPAERISTPRSSTWLSLRSRIFRFTFDPESTSLISFMSWLWRLLWLRFSIWIWQLELQSAFKIFSTADGPRLLWLRSRWVRWEFGEVRKDTRTSQCFSVKPLPSSLSILHLNCYSFTFKPCCNFALRLR